MYYRNVAHAAECGGVWVSRYMEGKMKGIYSINTNPLTNSFCSRMSKTNAICSKCYSRRMLQGIRKMCVPAFEYNSQLLSGAILPDDKLPVIRTKDVFRFSAHGELINQTHADNLYHIAKKNPDVIFGWWTKRLDLTLHPADNIIYVYSTPNINTLTPRIPKGFNKVFSTYTKTFVSANSIKINCKGAKEGGCNQCRLCYSHNNVTHINEVVK